MTKINDGGPAFPDLAPAPSVTVKTAAEHLLTIWDRWMAGEDANREAGFRMTQAACFAAQAYEDAASSGMAADSAPGQMLRALLVAMIDLSSPELDHLRACNRPSPKRATPEALASIRAGEGFATSGAEDRWIEDMKAGVYDASCDIEAVIAVADEITSALSGYLADDLTTDDKMEAADLVRRILAGAFPAPGETARVREIERLLRDGADLLQLDADALKEGISIAGDWQANLDPEDAHTVAAIREIEEWIGKVAALQPAPPSEGVEP